MDIAFEVPSPGVTVLFGPSGSGKSTIINAAAGLLRPDTCRIEVDGQVLADTRAGIWLPPERRRVGLVFQDSRLFPHMSVATNLRFGLRRVGAQARIGFDEVVDLLGIGALLARRPHTLSGGERQRVAIGRALLAQPHLLLMDEPLASLDTARKAEILPYPDPAEDGAEAAGPVRDACAGRGGAAGRFPGAARSRAGASALVRCPRSPRAADLPLAQRDDAGAVLMCRVEAHDAGRATDAPAGRRRHVPGAAAGSRRWALQCRIRIPAREVILAGKPPEAISLHNIVPGTVRRIAQDPVRRSVVVEIAPAERRACCRG